ncbi:T9SS type A sorting domain-containing protein [Reichenbachiella ulvae]|uniref:T9SS type A sorting domain-containing protein n=1 Tax=Reichenbachiella ulvae TaxID=2980104 RepID=A0ABT3CP77_9BACT|nr:T9SS type A sorting domain-containing protein [Reichenbachiella ulvae]MCV9385343.1 T9SS type A sorting domain-containing protein [Reichenbachiella ulvae]
MKKIIIAISLVLSLGEVATAQTSVADGDWIDGPTWGGTSPGYAGLTNPIVDSYVISNNTLTFSTVNGCSLSVYDTLIVYGSVFFDVGSNNAAIHVGANNVLIIFGDLEMGKNNAGANVETGGVLVVKGSITASGNNGEFTGGGNIYTDGTTAGMANNGTGTVETVADLSGDGLTTIEEFVAGGGTTPLPVKLLHFNAELADYEVNLSWATSIEINNDYFQLERSVNGNDFEAIAKISGAGDSNETIDYYFTDRNVSANVVYYRLKQVDFDGAFEYFNTVKVQMNQSSSVHVYPSLVKGASFQVVSEDLMEVHILNMKGAVIRSAKADYQSQLQVNVNDLQNGIYFVRTISGLGEVSTQRILIQR